MDELILALDDEKAGAVLAAMTRPLARWGGFETGWTPELGRALGEAFGVDAGSSGPTSKGDLARQALLVLAEDPSNHEPLAAFIKGGATESFSVGLDALIITGVLIALQVHGVIEKDKDGKITWKFERRPNSEAMLRPLVEKLMGWFSTQRN
jgi:hypothetical protein